MKSSLRILLLLVSLFPHVIHASFTKGNGGNILVCKNSESIVLDYYEMSELYNFEYDLKLDIAESFFDEIILRLKRLNEKSVIDFRSQLDLLSKNKVFVNANSLGIIDDVFDIFIPKDCELVQTIIQRNGRLLISRPLYDLLSKKQQDVLILHEVIYSTLLLKKDLNDSRPVRALVSLLLSQNIKNMTNEELVIFLKKNNIFL